jgi:hydroxymethylglutaryl-CoA reductase (NADPH)
MTENNVAERHSIPRSRDNDYTHAEAAARRAFIREHTGAELSHVAKYSFDPAILQGNTPTLRESEKIACQTVLPRFFSVS